MSIPTEVASKAVRSQVSPSVAIHFLCIQNLGGGEWLAFLIYVPGHIWASEKSKFEGFGGEEHVRITMFLFWTCYI